ncbi:MAG: YbaN family protein, partial [Candidatus Thermoplasmatota archaeon]|nr:YbaN family protein [Candidatus Thermoplasmatota archaeon]
MPQEGLRLARNPLARSVWMLLGHVCVAIGTIGAYVPGLPTVSFYVLAAAFYARGSEKFYNWLLHHPVFGGYV